MAKKSPHFYLKAGNDPALIILVHTFNRQRVTLSAGVTVPRKFWNAKAERVKESRDFPHYAKINALLNRLEALTLELSYDFKALGVKPSREEFKQAFKKKLGRQETQRPALFTFIRQLIEERKGMNRPQSSLNVYRNCLNHLEAYQKERRRQIDFADITESFKNDFVTYLFAQNFADSYVHKILTTLKMFLRDAWKRGINDNQGFEKIGLTVTKRGADNIYLNEREVETLASLDLSDNERLDRVRDLFLIGCFTGLRFSDFSAVAPENIRMIEHAGKEVECLVMTAKKTKQRVVIPLVNPALRAILEKYGNKAPKAITNQKLNEYLKELARLAGFTESVEVNEFRAGRHEKKLYQKWELVTSHTARRSFATNAFKRGLPAADIMKFTGHTTERQFMKYIKVTNEENAVILADHDFFTGKSPLKVAR